jgi:hypothetical protein
MKGEKTADEVSERKTRSKGAARWRMRKVHVALEEEGAFTPRCCWLHPCGVVLLASHVARVTPVLAPPVLLLLLRHPCGQPRVS